MTSIQYRNKFNLPPKTKREEIVSDFGYLTVSLHIKWNQLDFYDDS